MRNSLIATILLGVLIVFGLQSCETEVDITAEFKKIPVIYGIMDMDADTQFVMINRTFLGNGSATGVTLIEDSMLYTNVDARIYYGNNDNDFVQLDSTRITTKNREGIFYAPSQRVYFALTSDFPESIWTANTTLQLRITADGEDIYADTRVVDLWDNYPTGLLPSLNQTQPVTFYSQFGYVPEFKFEWKGFANAVKHQAFVIFNYTEQRIDGTETPKSVRIPFATSDAGSPGEAFNGFGRSGDFFYNSLANIIPQDAEVRRRAFGNLEFVIQAAGTDLTTYLNVGDPVSAVGQERPRYSNINGGEGIGVFSARKSLSNAKELSQTNQTSPTTTHLVEGELTIDLCFCDPTPGSTFDCAGNNVCQ